MSGDPREGPRRNPRKGPLGGRIAGGAAWLFGSYALSKIARVGMMLVVAALLSPREYGIIGLSAVAITLVQIVNESGIWQSVVHRRDPDESFLDTAFAANVLGGLLLCAGTFFVAPWISGFYGQPEMTVVLRVMGLALVLDAVFYVPDGLLRKELEFKSRALPEVASTLGAVLVTVGLLLWGFGVLSYAFGFVVESGIRCALTLWRISWRPGLKVSWTSLKEIVSYGKHILGSSLATYVASNIDYFVVGRVLGAGPLGFYTLAFNLANYPVSNFSLILSRLAFPTFAALQEDPAYAGRIYLKMVRAVAALVFPTLVVLAFLAPLLVTTFFGEKWNQAIFPLQVMVVAGISRAISIPGSDLLRAVGLPDLPLKVSLVEGLTVFGTLLFVASRGIEAVALAVTVVLSLAAWTITAITCRKFDIGLTVLLRALVPGMTLAAGGAAGVLLAGIAVPTLTPGALEVAVPVLAAGAVIVLCLVTVCRDFLHEMISLATSGRPK